jgi:hypothetical protein
MWLNLLVAAITLWNAVYLERAAELLARSSVFDPHADSIAPGLALSSPTLQLSRIKVYAHIPLMPPPPHPPVPPLAIHSSH